MKTEKRTTEKTCNKCGHKIQLIGKNPEEAFDVKMKWGYFSDKDGEVHHIVLCEKCYDEWISSFDIPVEKSDYNEMI